MDGEDRLLAWLRRRLGPTSLLGDDAAVLPAGGPPAASPAWAATVDSQIAGVHFPPGLDPRRLARRLLAVNLSDLAAMGAEPAYALLALAAPAGFDHRRFFTAFTTACRRAGVELAGGDLAASPAGPAATLTLLGRLPAGGGWLRRGAARPGDALWVGGTLGESAAGRHLLERGASWRGRGVELPPGLGLTGALATAARRAVRRHLQPEPQLALGQALGRLTAADEAAGGAAVERRPAAIDVSDGLATDLARLCAESGTGAEVDAESLPQPPRFAALCERLGRDPSALALGGGEDYVLLFTLPPAATPPTGHPCSRIGRITAGRALRLRGPDGTRPLPRLGWDHLAPRDGRRVKDHAGGR